MQLSIILFIFLISPVALAVKARDCFLFYSAWNRQVSQGYVKQSSLKKIQEIFASNSLSDAEKAKQAYLIVLEDRISLLDPKVARQVRDLIYEKPIILQDSLASQNQSSPIIGGSVDLSSIRATINIPKHYHNTIVEYLIRIHEHEHQMQILAQRRAFVNSHVLENLSLDDLTLLYFHREIASMIAEFEYLKSLPLSIRQSLSKEIEADSSIDTGLKYRFIRILNFEAAIGSFFRNSAHEPSAPLYIRMEHLHGTYSRATTKQLARDWLKKNFPGKSISAILLTIIAMKTKVCDQQPQYCSSNTPH